jgi:hypothetical protein
MARQMNFLPAKTSGRILSCSSCEPKFRTGGIPMESCGMKHEVKADESGKGTHTGEDAVAKATGSQTCDLLLEYQLCL